MKLNHLVYGLLIIVLVLATGCSQATQIAPTPTTPSTYTPFPTYTPLPTYTPIPTATETAIPTEIPPTMTSTAKPYVAPTKAPATQAPQQSSGGNTPITWANETSHVIKIVATGPTTYTLTLQAHETQQVNWNAGTYQIKYYLDGSGSIAGSESITVIAEEHYLYTLNFR